MDTRHGNWSLFVKCDTGHYVVLKFRESSGFEGASAFETMAEFAEAVGMDESEIRSLFEEKSQAEDYVTVAEAAEELRLSESTVRRCIKRGNIQAEKTSRGLRIKRSDLIAVATRQEL